MWASQCGVGNARCGTLEVGSTGAFNAASKSFWSFSLSVIENQPILIIWKWRLRFRVFPPYANAWVDEDLPKA
jgi:hypothetical protein